MPLRFNHMELTLPLGTFAKDKQNLVEFYGDVFGFEGVEVPMVDLDCPKFLLRSDDEASQFFFLVEDKDALQSKSFDHLGFLLDTRAEVDEALRRCKDWAKRDSRIEILEYEDSDVGPLVTHAFYVRYILPIYFDVQALEYKTESVPPKTWQYA